MARLTHEHIAAPLRRLAVPLDGLVLDPENARKHSERNLASIEVSLRKFGQRLPIVVQREGGIVRAGNGRVMVARRMGWTHIAALVIEEKDIDARAFALADNRTGELAEWDYQVLASLVGKLGEEGVDVAALGWDAAELAQLTRADWEPPNEAEDLEAFGDSISSAVGGVVRFDRAQWASITEHCGTSEPAAVAKKLVALVRR
jgi:ParB-like chromosome segregation protein Spo0J